jgi:hypothetical protein
MQGVLDTELARIRTVPWPALAGPLAFVAALALAMGLFPASNHSHPVAASAAQAEPAGAAALPASLRPVASDAIGLRSKRFWARAVPGALATGAPALQAVFSADGADLVSPAGTVTIRTVAIGRMRTSAQPPVAHHNTVTYRSAAGVARYSNGPYGIEQTFTIPRHAAGHGQVIVAMALAGSLHPVQRGQRILFGPSGHPVLSYSGLRAQDRYGRPLPVRMRLRGSRLELRLDTAGARFPVRLDPFVEQAQLAGQGGGFGGFGDHAVALSADGNTALVGGWDGEPPYALLFTRSGSTWSAGVPLQPEEGRVSPAREFGASVALSADGTTALVGSPQSNSEYGVVWAFTKEGGTWSSTRVEPATGTEGGPARFGWAVALSADGNTAVVGGPVGAVERTETGAWDGSAWIFARSGRSWTMQAGPLHGGERVNPYGNQDEYGGTLAISADGNTVLVGAPREQSGIGGVWVYRRSGSTWTQDGPRLNPPGEQGTPSFGDSVSVSADGARALIGSGTENDDGGTAWIFARGATGWTEQARFTPGYSEELWGDFGWTVAISSSGNTGVIGAWDTPPLETGEVWGVRCTSSGWTQEAIPPPVGGEANFGQSVAISGDGATALAAAPGTESGKGSAYVFGGPSDSAGSCADSSSPSGNSPAATPHGGSAALVQSLRESHQTWREGSKLARFTRARSGAPLGTTFTFSMSASAPARLTFSRLAAGRLLDGRCRRAGGDNRRGARCRLALTAGTLTLHAHAGHNRLDFDGRLSPRLRLAHGTYELAVRAVDGVTLSVPRRVRFKIVA